MKKKLNYNFKILISIVICLIIYQLISYFLSKVPFSRHPVDRLIYNLNYSTEFSEYIILGNSITRDVIKRYRANDTKIINLTVDQPSGLIGSYFLLKRYLNKNDLKKKTSHVFIASTPEFFSNFNIGKALSNEIYLNSIFTNEDEIVLLNKLNIYPKSYSNVEKVKKYFNLKKNVLDPIFALLKIEKKTILVDGIKFELENINNLPSIKTFDEITLQGRYKEKLSLNSEAFYIFNKICELSQKYNFKLHIILAPTHNSLYEKWTNNGEITNLYNSLASKDFKNCTNFNFIDLNQIRVFPNYAFRDQYHLKINYWSKLYTQMLYDYIENKKN